MRRRAVASSRKERPRVDQGRFIDAITQAVDDNRRRLSAVSRGLGLCESTLSSGVSEVRAWVTSALEVQQGMVLRMMSDMVMLGKAIERSGARVVSRGRSPRRPARSLASTTC